MCCVRIQWNKNTIKVVNDQCIISRFYIWTACVCVCVYICWPPWIKSNRSLSMHCPIYFSMENIEIFCCWFANFFQFSYFYFIQSIRFKNIRHIFTFRRKTVQSHIYPLFSLLSYITHVYKQIQKACGCRLLHSECRITFLFERNIILATNLWISIRILTIR